MNFNSKPDSPPPTPEQAQRLRQVVAEIVRCCQDRNLFESQVFDLPQAELRCLLLLRQDRYLTAGELARRLEVGKSRVTKLVDGLLDKRLLEKVDDPRDGRIKLLTLTKSGQVRSGEYDKFLTSVHSRVLGQLDLSQRAAVLAALDLLWTAMESVRAELGIG